MEDDRNNGQPAQHAQATLSRRSLFGIAGLAVAAAVVPLVAQTTKPSSSGSTMGQGVSPAHI